MSAMASLKFKRLGEHMRYIGPRYRERIVEGDSSLIEFGTSQTFIGAAHPILATHPWLQDTPYDEPHIHTSGPGVAYPDSALYERCWDSTNPGPPYQTGGEFTKVKVSIPNHLVLGVGQYEEPKSQVTYYQYKGGFGNPYFDTFDETTLSEYADMGLNQSDPDYFPSMDSLGNGAYARLRPSIERAGLGVALAEARDLPRMLSTTSRTFSDIWENMGGSMSGAIMQPRNVANNFLNVQFGWIPFLKDVSQLYDVTVNMSSYIAQQERDNGQWVKRARTDKVLESEVVMQAVQQRRCEPLLSGVIYQPGVPLAAWNIIRDYTLVWYEGVFKYYRPELDKTLPEYFSDWAAVKRVSNLYGLRVSPAVIWKATPWTWLIDWVSNVGDVIQRAADWGLDGVVSKYMYLMHHKMRTLAVRQYLPLKSGAKILEWPRIVEVKRRRAASSSFGFSLTPSQLSGRQFAILGALGMSRR